MVGQDANPENPVRPAGPVVVLKVGGSLLGSPGWAARVAEEIDRIEGRPLVIVGGGAVGDVVRNWDRVHGFDAEVAHELALASLGPTAALAVRSLPAAVLCRTRSDAAAAWDQAGIPVLDVAAFLTDEETPGNRLPRTWEVTTDSIAAWVATRWPAERVVLFKSRQLPDEANWMTAAALGLVDPWFPRFAAGLDVCWRAFAAGDAKTTRRPTSLTPSGSFKLN